MSGNETDCIKAGAGGEAELLNQLPETEAIGIQELAIEVHNVFTGYYR